MTVLEQGKSSARTLSKGTIPHRRASPVVVLLLVNLARPCVHTSAARNLPVAEKRSRLGKPD